MPSVQAAPGQDLAAYADRLLRRFSNAALQHRLVQIAMDGSQKIPQRWLATLVDARKTGRACPSLLRALAAWMLHLRGDNGPVDDPMASRLRSLWHGYDALTAARGLFGANGVFASVWTASDDDLCHIAAYCAEREQGDA